MEKFLQKIGLHVTTASDGESAIKEITRNKRFDMIIMGTKGRSAWGDTLMGSVAHRVACASKVPVLLIQP